METLIINLNRTVSKHCLYALRHEACKSDEPFRQVGSFSPMGVNDMNKILLSAALTLSTLVSAPASAAVVFTFTAGGASPSGGFTVINTFANAAGITGSGFQIKTPPADGDGAPPANSLPAGTSYLSVLGGGSATIALGMVSAFQFDWGSIDSYNTLTISSTGGPAIIIPGSNFTNPADGNQIAPGTNGLFTVTGTAGELFTGITLTSSGNSFEIDNLAVGGAVPESATWMMMIFGFGLTGTALRVRRQTTERSWA